MAKATQTISAAVTEMEHANRELVKLLEVRTCRPWSADEFARYLDLSQHERAAHRQYLAGRHWFDNARRQRAETPRRAGPDIGRLTRPVTPSRTRPALPGS